MYVNVISKVLNDIKIFSYYSPETANYSAFQSSEEVRLRQLQGVEEDKNLGWRYRQIPGYLYIPSQTILCQINLP